MSAPNSNHLLLVGDKSTFAIESGITHAYERLSFRALGFFVLHIGSHSYGVREPDATMLACSFDEVKDRIAQRATHIAPFANVGDAGKIADAYRDAIYAPNQENEQFFGIPCSEFSALIYSNHLKWAPDGDEAFDDSSYVLQFDIEDQVRLIAFKSTTDGYHHVPQTLRDVWLSADDFYGVLEKWAAAFEASWKTLPKQPK